MARRVWWLVRAVRAVDRSVYRCSRQFGGRVRVRGRRGFPSSSSLAKIGRIFEQGGKTNNLNRKIWRYRRVCKKKYSLCKLNWKMPYAIIRWVPRLCIYVDNDLKIESTKPNERVTKLTNDSCLTGYFILFFNTFIPYRLKSRDSMFNR